MKINKATQMIRTPEKVKVAQKFSYMELEEKEKKFNLF